MISHSIVKRGGRPFLYLPESRRAASAAFALYPAQSLKARLAKSVLSSAVAFGLRPGLKNESVSIPENDAFSLFLRKTAGLGRQDALCFAVLAGNPNVEGRRHVFLLFDSAARPVIVVKAGLGEAARKLITGEIELIKSLPAQAAALPHIRGTYFSDSADAFAMDFIAGESPSGECAVELERVFSSWLDTTQTNPIHETSAWNRLAQSFGTTSLPSEIQTFGKMLTRRTLMHGDFAPWNVKVTGNKWAVLDWERGEREGVPGWDWFHFLLQPAVLVKRDSIDVIIEMFERLFVSEEFFRYAKAAGINGHERHLLVAYLSHCVRVAKQSEGMTTIQSLEKAMRARWRTTEQSGSSR